MLPSWLISQLKIDFKTIFKLQIDNLIPGLPGGHNSLKTQPEGGVQNLIYYNPLLTEFAIDYFFIHSNERNIFSQIPFKLC